MIAWIILSLVLFIVGIGQLVQLIREVRHLTALRTWKLITFTVLFYLTFCAWIVQDVMERIDWAVFYNKRNEIVEQVRSGQLKPNGKWNAHLCKLPFELPVVSDGGNEILISRNETTNALTVAFWTLRGMPEGGSRSFVYSNNKEEVLRMDKKVHDNPNENNKMEVGWYLLKDE